jgi:hypothetical protein
MQKNKFCASFQFYFLRLFLVGENLLVLYEQSLIWTDIGGSPLRILSSQLYKLITQGEELLKTNLYR